MFHKKKDRLYVYPKVSLCFNCSNLITNDKSNKEISAIKPLKYSIIQKNAIPIFLSVLNKKPFYSFKNKTGYLNVQTLIAKNMKSFFDNLKLNKKTFFYLLIMLIELVLSSSHLI